MNGALSARAMAESQEDNGQSVSGVTVGGGRSTSSSSPGPPRGPSRAGGGEVEQVESTGRMLTGHPAIAGLVEYVQV